MPGSKGTQQVAADPVPEKPVEDGANENAGDKKFEIADGVWDPIFTAVSGLVAVALIVLEIVVTSSYGDVIGPGLRITEVPKDTELNGTFVERFVAMLSIVGMTIGVGALTIGSWLAVLELRARLAIRMVRVPRKGAGESSAGKNRSFWSGKVLETAATSIAVFVEKLGGVRGTIAIIIAGITITVASLVTGASLVGSTAPDEPDPNSSSSAAPSESSDTTDDTTDSSDTPNDCDPCDPSGSSGGTSGGDE
jgi:hypothetical protein